MPKTLSFDRTTWPGDPLIYVATVASGSGLAVAAIVNPDGSRWSFQIAGDVGAECPERYDTPQAAMIAAALWVTRHLVECSAAWPDDLDPDPDDLDHWPGDGPASWRDEPIPPADAITLDDMGIGCPSPVRPDRRLRDVWKGWKP